VKNLQELISNLYIEKTGEIEVEKEKGCQRKKKFLKGDVREVVNKMISKVVK